MSGRCPTCHQELPDAVCMPESSPAKVKCDVRFCPRPAMFLSFRRARCFEHRDAQVSAEFLSAGILQPKGGEPEEDEAGAPLLDV